MNSVVRCLDAGRRSALTLSVGLVAILAAVVPGTAAVWGLQPDALASGALWQLWTGHLVHYGGGHLGHGLLAFVFLAGWIERQNRRLLASFLLIAAPLNALAIAGLTPGLLEYRGLSGVDMGLAVLAGICFCRRLGMSRPRIARGFGLAMVAVIGGQLALERFGGGELVESLGSAAVLAHAAHESGALLGLIWGLLPVVGDRLVSSVPRIANGNLRRLIPADGILVVVMWARRSWKAVCQTCLVSRCGPRLLSVRTRDG